MEESNAGVTMDGGGIALSLRTRRCAKSNCHHPRWRASVIVTLMGNTLASLACLNRLSRLLPAPSFYDSFLVEIISSILSFAPFTYSPRSLLSNDSETFCSHIMFTATSLQAVTYLLGVCLFSIAFLVFLNSSVSFVITTLIGQRTQVGDAVGTLGFADEVVALVACPVWGVLSDRIGVRMVRRSFSCKEDTKLKVLARSVSWATLSSV